AHPAAPVASGLTQRPAAPAAPTVKETPVPTPHVDLSVPVKLPAPMSFPILEKKPEPQPLQKPQEPSPITPAPVPIAPASTPMQSLPGPTAPVQPKLVVPAAAKTPAEVKPPAPVAPSQTTPPLISSSQPPAPRIPASPPRAPAEIPPGVAALHVVDSLSLDCILMLVVAIAMAAHTLRYRSQFVTGLAFLLGYTTVALSQDTVYSLSAGVVLAIGLVSIVLKMGWFELEVF